MEKVLVTGATGFIGLHCIQQLLNQGYQVNGSLRSMDRKGEVIESLENNNTPVEHLSLLELDLMSDDGWDAAMEGCDYVLHVASPFVLSNESLDFFVKPAVEGATRALKFAKKNNVRMSNYSISKTLAEKAAWDYVKDNDVDFKLSVINPTAVIGPSLSKDIGVSNSLILRLLNGSMPALAKIHIGYVDVRDVAKAHILAMTNSASDGERFIVSEKEMWLHESAEVLNNAGFKAPSRVMPNWFLKIMAMFNGDMVTISKMAGKSRDCHSTKAKDVLGWNPIPAEDSILETAKQLIEYKLI